MSKKNLLMYLCWLIVIIALIIYGIVNESDDALSFGIGMVGPAIGIIIGTFIRERSHINNPKRLRIELYILLPLAIIGSFIIAYLIDNYDIRWVSVVIFNLLLLFLFLFRNLRNIQAKK